MNALYHQRRGAPRRARAAEPTPPSAAAWSAAMSLQPTIRRIVLSARELRGDVDDVTQDVLIYIAEAHSGFNHAQGSWRSYALAHLFWRLERYTKARRRRGCPKSDYAPLGLDDVMPSGELRHEVTPSPAEQSEAVVLDHRASLVIAWAESITPTSRGMAAALWLILQRARGEDITMKEAGKRHGVSRQLVNFQYICLTTQCAAEIT